jgi:hypothetical protein
MTCPYCFGEHEPDNENIWVEWKGVRYQKPFFCLCCGEETCARQWAYGRTCGICDTGICQRDSKYFHAQHSEKEILAKMKEKIYKNE